MVRNTATICKMGCDPFCFFANTNETLPHSFRRLQSNTTINGTLRATLVPYGKEDASHDAVVALLDKHAGSYPIGGEVSVSWCCCR